MPQQPNSVYAAYVAAYMAREGITLTRYAALIGADPRTVQMWISGAVKCPRTPHLIKICKLHDVDFGRPEDLGFAPRATSRNYPTLGGSSGWVPEDEDVVMMLRRDLLGMTAAVVYSTALAGPVARMLGAGPDAATVHVGTAEIERVDAARRGIQMSGNLLGGNALGWKALLREHRAAVTMLHGRFTSDTQRKRAHAVAANLAMTVGWNLYDLGMHDQARKAWLGSLAIARGTDPTTTAMMHAIVLDDMATQSIALGRPQEALDLLGMVSGRERLLPLLLRAELCGTRAQATAALGDAEETRRQIGWARDHIQEVGDDRNHLWNDTGWYNEAEMDGVASHALATLGVVRGGAARDDALDRASASLAGFRDDDARSRARVYNTLFRLHAAARDVAATEAAGRTAVDSARLLRSPRVIGELVAIRPRLAPLRRHPGIAEIDRDIAALGKDTAT